VVEDVHYRDRCSLNWLPSCSGHRRIARVPLQLWRGAPEAKDWNAQSADRAVNGKPWRRHVPALCSVDRIPPVMPRLCCEEKCQPAIVQRAAPEQDEGDRHEEQHTHLSREREPVKARISGVTAMAFRWNADKGAGEDRGTTALGSMSLGASCSWIGESSDNPPQSVCLT
jgi:hypothetical protein